MEKTATQLINSKCRITYDKLSKEIFGSDLLDQWNEPKFFSRSRRGLEKAWAVLQDSFTEDTSMEKVRDILRNCNIYTHYYCAVD